MAKYKKPMYSNEDLFEQVRMVAYELGRIPRRIDFDNDYRTASAVVCVNRFGSWDEFLMCAGLKSRPPVVLLHDEAVEHTLLLAIKLGRTPTLDEFTEYGREQNFVVQSCLDLFGGWDNLIKETGLR